MKINLATLHATLNRFDSVVARVCVCVGVQFGRLLESVNWRAFHFVVITLNGIGWIGLIHSLSRNNLISTAKKMTIHLAIILIYLPYKWLTIIQIAIIFAPFSTLALSGFWFVSSPCPSLSLYIYLSLTLFLSPLLVYILFPVMVFELVSTVQQFYVNLQ